MATTIEDLKNQIMERAKAQIATAEHDYQKGFEPCIFHNQEKGIPQTNRKMVNVIVLFNIFITFANEYN